MNTRSLYFCLFISTLLLLGALIGCIVIQRADYRTLIKQRREELAMIEKDRAQIMEIFGRKAVLVSPIDASMFEKAAGAKP